MKYKILHKWKMPPRKAMLLQSRLAERVFLQKIPVEKVRLVAGVDVSVKKGRAKAAIVTLSFPGLEIIETVTYESRAVFPYIPGLLSFREAPVILECVKKLKVPPDVFIFDGQGMAHPRRLGIACHVGLFLEKPSIGCAKSRLYGTYSEPGTAKGDFSVMRDKDGTELGAALRTRVNTKPVYVSPGHLTDIPSSIELILACSRKYRIPEPAKRSHNAASLVRNKLA